jgi:hypothetical protein
MSLILSGTDGLSDVDGSAATPAIRGTDANTGIFFPAADTIAFSEGGAECARFDSAGNFGLGVTPSAWGSAWRALQIGSITAVAQGSAAQSVLSNNSYIDGTNARYLSTGLSSFYQQYQGEHSWWFSASGSAGAVISSTKAMVLDTAGGLKTYNTIGVGNTAPSTSGAGITFPATQSASSDANTLDDYEEGTWTPTVVGSSTAGTYTVVPIGCVYTKIGRMVALQFNIQFSAASGGSGQAVIGNLPFAMSNSGLAAPGALTARFLNTTASTSNGLSAMRTSGNAGVTDFGMVLVIDNANWEIISISAINTSTEIVGQLTYIS